MEHYSIELVNHQFATLGNKWLERRENLKEKIDKDLAKVFFQVFSVSFAVEYVYANQKPEWTSGNS